MGHDATEVKPETGVDTIRGTDEYSAVVDSQSRSLSGPVNNHASSVGLPGVLDAELARPGLLHELFESQARLRPDAVAIECDGRCWTYGELDRATNRLARWLRSRGVGRGACVAFWLPRSADVYVALLGILKSGAAYVPLDPDYPADRVSYILNDCRVPILLTTADLARSLSTGETQPTATSIVAWEQLGELLVSESDALLAAAETGVMPHDLCYVIYTSGSTGRPKGVQIEHRNACHLVRVEQRLFDMRPDDRVYQGFSVAFDASVEEIWLAFASGATLVAATREMQHAGASLPRLLTDARVTVLSCVPTLLSMMEEDIPTLRLLITGGEQCLPDLVRRWWRPHRRMFNTYGPTEATVIATYVECHPDRPVTIGRPLPNYFAFILDPDLRPVRAGESGELCLGGSGLARGYVGRPDLTEQKFIANPFRNDGEEPARLYRTGDLTRFTDDGEIEFLGRIDSQVKLRGFRVELTEIEAVLLECPNVRGAATTVREDTPGVQQLVGYVILREGGSLDETAVRDVLRAKLPTYMVPSVLEVLDKFPTLTSGKVDRKRLPMPRSRGEDAAAAVPLGRTPREQRLATAFAKLFAPLPVSLQDDFFRDLGGHSLLAARLVSELRKEPMFAALSMLDVYQYTTVESLAVHLERTMPRESGADIRVEQASSLPSVAAVDSLPNANRRDAGSTTREVHHPTAIGHFLCGLAQFVALYFVMGFFALQWIGPYLTYSWLVERGYSISEALVGAFSSLLAVYPVMLVLGIVVKWIVMGRVRPGRYPLWGMYYFRWWFTRSVLGSIPIDYLAGTPLLNIYYRLMGARIGRNVHFESDPCGAHDLISIGDDTSIGNDVHLSDYAVEDGWLKLERIEIGSRCFVGSRSVIGQNSRLEDDSALEDLSLLPEGKTIPRGQRWRGSPARPLEPRTCDEKTRRAAASPAARPSLLHQIAFGVMYALGTFILPTFVLAAILPGMIVMNQLHTGNAYFGNLWLSPFVALSFVVLLCLEIAAVKWLLLGRVTVGTYPLHSLFYFKKWFVDQLLELSLDVVGTLYSTIYLAPWYRLLGARIGRRSEISTASFISPDLLDLADEVFIADAVSLGAPRVDAGCVTIGPTHIGKRSFIGNSAMLPPGTTIGEGCLIGCLSVPPDQAETRGTTSEIAVPSGTSWLGSPAFVLPRRQQWSAFSDATTFKPSRKLWVQRAVIEFFRVILPSTGFICLTSMLLSVITWLARERPIVEVLALFPIVYAGAGIASVLIVAALKWLLMGRYRPGQHPLWSLFVWRTELVTALFENFSKLFFMEHLTGTPFIGWFLKLFGAKIGKRVYLESIEMTEFDLVDVGDEAALNNDCTIQTHLFEDRVMKMGEVRIGRGCNVGSVSVVLYDTNLESGSSLGDLSLLMKEEVLPAGTRWEGIPARSC